LLTDLIGLWATSPFGNIHDQPWNIVSNAALHIQRVLGGLGQDYDLDGNIARHCSSTVEAGAVIKGPAIIGANCFIASGALLRGGCFLDQGCIIGPGVELKSSFLFSNTKLAHFNFVGDSILGEDVNLEAGSIIANYRNELSDKTIRIGLIDTGVSKFGALVGDHARLGANAVLAPGTIIGRGRIVQRLELVDQYPGDG
jgi:NDP-sugar pyrophosphorylase family protein